VADWVSEANRTAAAGGEPVGDADLREMLDVFGLVNLLDSADAAAPSSVVALSEQREQARAARDFAAADRLRDEIREAGWEVRDGPAGPELISLER
jgi:cysteinyl-tRNA synthetase